MTRRPLRNLIVVTLPAALVAGLVMAAAVEGWTRARWDPRKGRPGFFLSDARRGIRLAAGYDGWFANVPVHTNSLELRDPREYALAKAPNTFRILVLGDSVTFGHGSVYEHTYPYLVEQRLKAWKPAIDWQVWNAAVPGYNTSQEFAQLLEVGPRFQPDLVIVGFYENDLVGNALPGPPPGEARRAAARLMSWARSRFYSFELYKKVYLTLAWRLSASTDYRLRVEHLATEEALLNVGNRQELAQQQLTPFDRLTDDEVAAMRCATGQKPSPDGVRAMQRDPGYGAWLASVRALQQLHREGRYRIAFFVNYVPPICPDGDAFYDGGSKEVNAFYLRTLGEGTPALSCLDAFLHVRPSQMPNARGHTTGNSNVVKAETLFAFLRDALLPGLLPGASEGR